MKTIALPLTIVCAGVLASACGKRASPPADPQAMPLIVEAHHPGTAPESSIASVSTPESAPPDAAPPSAKVPSLAPAPAQREELASLRGTIQDQLKAAVDARARQAAQAQEQWRAEVAGHNAKQNAKQAVLAEETKAKGAQEKAKWQADQAKWRAILADPKASAADKENARMASGVAFVPSAPAADIPTQEPPPPPPPLPSIHSDPKANQAFDALTDRFRQAVAARDHDKAVALMRKLVELAPLVSPAQANFCMDEVNRYLNAR